MVLFEAHVVELAVKQGKSILDQPPKLLFIFLPQSVCVILQQLMKRIQN